MKGRPSGLVVMVSLVGAVRSGCSLRWSRARTANLTPVPLTGIRDHLAVKDAPEASERVITAFDVVVGPPLYLNSVAAKSFNLLLAEGIHHSRSSHFA